MKCTLATSTTTGAMAAIGAVLLLIKSAQACSTVIAHPMAGSATVSARTVDFDADTNTTINAIPKHSVLWGQLYPEDLPRYAHNNNRSAWHRLHYKAKHSFLATVQHHFKPWVQDMVPEEYRYMGGNLWTVVMDGINDAGLSCAYQYDLTIKNLDGPADAFAESDVNDTARPHVFNIYALCKYIMATFSSAEDAVQALNPNTTQIVQPRALAEAGLPDFFPIHMFVKDRHRQLWLLEMVNDRKDGNETLHTFKWSNATEWGVVTNAPHYQAHLDHLQDFIHSNATVEKTIAAADAYIAGDSAHATLPSDADMMPLLGGSESRARFVRLAVLNRIAPYANFPAQTDSYMPMDASYSNNSALVTAMLLINTVTLARGHMPGSSITGAASSGQGAVTFCTTQWRILCDHTHLDLYFQAYADMAWAKVSLPAAMKGKKPIREFAVPKKERREHMAKTGTVETGRKLVLDTYAIPLNVGKLGSMVVNADAKF